MDRTIRRMLLRVLRCGRMLVLLAVILGTPYLSGCGTVQPSEASVGVAQTAATCTDGVQTSGALYRICMPSFPMPWNGDLVIFAHGYMPPGSTLRIPEEQLVLPDGTSIPNTVTQLGYAFAMSSYSANGLAIREGIADTAELVGIFRAAHPTLNRVYLVGASEGGLITALSVEQHPEIYSGGLATCGPIGDFRTQINYMGDFRVLFDYYFPGVLPGSAVDIPPELLETWDQRVTEAILPAISAPGSQISVTQILSVTQALYGPLSLREVMTDTITGTLWYNVFATTDAILKLGGQPFDNTSRVYSGALDDAALNAGVRRYTAERPALNEIEAYYQTIGQPRVPLVTLHTSLDPIVPYRHEILFRDKVVAHDMTLRHDNLVEERCGHCNFTTAQVLQALLLLQSRVVNPLPTYTPTVPSTATPTSTHEPTGTVTPTETPSSMATPTNTPAPTVTITPTTVPSRSTVYLPLVVNKQ